MSETIDAVAPGQRSVGLADVLANRRWIARAKPFPHIVATDVFTPEFFARLDAQFRGLLRDHPEDFRRGIPNYDAGASDVQAVASGPLGVFVSRDWHDLIGALTGVTGTGDVIATMHHHEPGSRRGWPHNDLNPGFFGGPPPGRTEIRTESDSTVSYRDGSSPDDSAARATVRAVSLLFYLGNGPWRPGDGGETGLFRQITDAEPLTVVPPIDNSLVLFECTPYSLHSFMGTATARNSVVMWLHRPMSDAIARWGEHSIVRW